jgi:HMG (high mobility group) box.
VKTAHPEMKMWDIGKLIGEQWRNLPEDERQVSRATSIVPRSSTL